MPSKPSLIGNRFGRVFIYADAPSKSWKRRSFGRCDCGKDGLLFFNKYLLNGNTKSCGCLQKEIQQATIKSSWKHGFCRTRTYNSWASMIARCSNPVHPNWQDYGAKGITVADRWRTFSNFLADMGERPVGTSVDRWPNQKGNYEPGNCRWGTDKQQQRNKSSNRILTVNGITACLAEHCERLKIPRGRVKNRLRMGWPIEMVFDSRKFVNNWHRESLTL